MGANDITIPGQSATTMGDHGGSGLEFEVPRGTPIDRYVVTGKIGEGGMGVVYSAYDPELDRRLALKLLRWGHGSSGGSNDSDGGRARLMREAQAMARLRHPNVITVHDVGTWNEQLFVAMEFVEGGTLNAWLEHRRPRWRETLRVLVKAGRGLAAAHAAHLIHRDFKPDNVLISHAGEVFVTDFGLARPLRSSSDLEAGAVMSNGVLDTPLTQTGTLMGTPAYMAPEQFMGRTATEASDQFSFCVTAFVSLFGSRPFPGSTMQELMASVAAGRRQDPPARRGVPKWIERAILRGLAVRPEHRWPSMAALLEHLEVDPWVTRRRVLATGGIALAAAVGTGVAVASTDDVAQTPSTQTPVVQTTAQTPAEPCPRPTKTLSEVWDDARREELRGHFTASGLPYAKVMSARVTSALDAYANDWLDAHQRACRASRVDGVQSEAVYVLQISCLERRRSQLGELVTVLQKADSDLITRALDAVDRNLAGLGGCEDVDTLLREARREADPDRRSRIEDLEASLDRAAARLAGHELDEAETLLRRALQSATTLALPRQEALALAHLAHLETARGNYDQARTYFEQTLEACARGKDDRLAAATWAELIFLMANDLGRPRDAIAMESAAKLALVRAGDEPQLRANLLSDLGSAYKAAGLYDEAADHQQQALDLRIEVYGEDDHRVFDALGNLANVRVAQGRLEEGLEMHERVLAHRIARLGENHPEVATSHNNVAGTLYMLGRREEAIAEFEAAISIRTAVYGEDHVLTLEAYSNLASALQGLGRHLESERLLRRVLESTERLYPDDPYRIASPLNNLGNALERLERYDEAIDAHRRALDLRQRRFGRDHRLVAQSLANLGLALSNKGELDEALRRLEEAVAIYDAIGQSEQVESIVAGENLARLHLDRGELEAAEPLFRRAIEARVRSGADPGDLAATRFELARLRWERGDRAEAGSLAQQAAEELERLGLDPQLAAEIAIWRKRHA